MVVTLAEIQSTVATCILQAQQHVQALKAVQKMTTAPSASVTAWQTAMATSLKNTLSLHVTATQANIATLNADAAATGATG
jgi:hypothetical protein